MTALSVNVNKIALLRNSRQGKGPDVVKLARLALEAGAAGITVHPRPDERHITAQDTRDLSAMLRAEFPDREFNIEGNPFEGRWLELVMQCKPDQATLVPDDPSQSTSDHGFEFPRDTERLSPIIASLKSQAIRVSVFVDPVPTHMAGAREAGADRVELYTETYAVAHAEGGAAKENADAIFAESAAAAEAVGLGVNAGHDLNLLNLGDFQQAVGSSRLLEVSIGHALIGDAIELGMNETVRRYQALLGH